MTAVEFAAQAALMVVVMTMLLAGAIAWVLLFLNGMVHL